MPLMHIPGNIWSPLPDQSKLLQKYDELKARKLMFSCDVLPYR